MYVTNRSWLLVMLFIILASFLHLRLRFISDVKRFYPNYFSLDFTPSCKSIIYEESEKVERNGISDVITQDKVPAGESGEGGEVGSCCCTS